MMLTEYLNFVILLGQQGMAEVAVERSLEPSAEMTSVSIYIDGANGQDLSVAPRRDVMISTGPHRLSYLSDLPSSNEFTIRTFALSSIVEESGITQRH